jgi:aspartate/methionine/tyrosine aminotransferase
MCCPLRIFQSIQYHRMAAWVCDRSRECLSKRWHSSTISSTSAPLHRYRSVRRSGWRVLGDEYYTELARIHEHKRDLFCDALRDAGLTPSVPAGAYYVMTDVSSVVGNDDFEKAMEILEKTGVASVPGRAFYHDDAGKNMVRFCYSKPLRCT